MEEMMHLGKWLEENGNPNELTLGEWWLDAYQGRQDNPIGKMPEDQRRLLHGTFNFDALAKWVNTAAIIRLTNEMQRQRLGA